MQSKTIQLDQTSYHYLEWENPGKPKILLLHGLKVESHCWVEVADGLKAHFHLFALDLKGHGLSGRGKTHHPDYTLDQISREIKEFYQKVLQEAFYIAGYSLGGQFVMNYAARYPETLKGAMLLDTAPDVSLKGVIYLLLLGLGKNKIYESPEALKTLYAKKGFEKIGNYLADYTLQARPDGRCEYRFDVAHIAPSTASGYRQRVAALWERLSQIKVPTLLIKAEKSQIISQRIVKKMKAALPALKIEVLHGEGHEMVFTAPEKVAGMLKNFIQGS